jgi:hypothetical protein
MIDRLTIETFCRCLPHADREGSIVNPRIINRQQIVSDPIDNHQSCDSGR